MPEKFRNEEKFNEENLFAKDIEIDRAPDDATLEKETADLGVDARLRSLNTRVVLLSVLGPCLLAAIFVFFYYELRQRVDRTMDLGTKEVQSLSHDVVGRLDALSKAHDDLGKSITEGLDESRKAIASLKEAVAKNDQAVQELKASQVNRKELAGAIKGETGPVSEGLQAVEKALSDEKALLGEVAGRLEVLEKERSGAVAALRGELDKMEGKISEIAQSTAILKKEAKIRELEMKDLADRKADKADMDLTRLYTRIAGLENEVKSLREAVSGLGRAPAMPSAPGEAPKAPAPKGSGIVEQEVDE